MQSRQPNAQIPLLVSNEGTEALLMKTVQTYFPMFGLWRLVFHSYRLTDCQFSFSIWNTKEQVSFSVEKSEIT